MKISQWLLVIATSCVALPAAAVDVNVDYDKSADFSQYKTYARKAMTPAPSSLVQGRIDDATDRELAASATVTHKAEKSEKKITKAAKQMFKDFPPGQGE